MASILDDIKSYICVDVETGGPVPGMYPLLSIGACTIGEPRRNYYAELQPDKTLTDPQAMAIHGLTLEDLQHRGQPPQAALVQFENWLSAVVPPGERPLFVAFNAPFDWSFVNEYFFRYLGHNPFGHSAIDIKALYMGLSGKPWKETSGDYLHRLYNNAKMLSHNALEDAVNQAVIFEGILAEYEKINVSE